MPFQQDTNLRLDVDPKIAWAEENLKKRPVEINRASRQELLRIPGIGPKMADLILQARHRGTLSELAHLRKIGVRDVTTTGRYILLNGKQPTQQLSLFYGSSGLQGIDKLENG
ncbi:helix-hairpin-helix domain-containing protein [Chloroflexi bacterium TSY]|nr:helix-hairpin-helix domain-containing protein [Chloroflexi bacterium TSY]